MGAASGIESGAQPIPHHSSKALFFFALIAGASLLCAPIQAADDPAPTEAFAQLPLISGAELSPDGRHFAYFRPVKGRRYLVVQPVGTGERPYALPPQGDLEFRWLKWVNEERIVFSMMYSAKRGTTEVTETRLVSMRYDATDLVPIVKPGRKSATGLRTNVQLPPPQIQDDVIDWLPDEPDFILVSVDDDEDAQDDVRRIDIRNGDFDIVQRGTRGIQGWVTDQNHDVRLGYGYDPVHGYNMKVRPVDGRWTDVEKHAWWDQGFQPEAFSEDPSVVYVMGPDDRGMEIVSTLSLETGQIIDTIFAHDRVDAAGLVIDPVSRNPVGVRFVDDYPRVEYFDEGFIRLQKAIDRALPGTVNRITSMSADRQQILIRSTSDIFPGSYYFWDRESGRMDHIAESMLGLLPEQLSEVQSHWIEASDGLNFETFLTIPSGEASEPMPAVILPHGGPWARDDRSFWFLSQFLASRGYAVLQPNFRGSTGYGAAFQQAGNNQWGGLMQDDVSAATRWLTAEGIADPDRVCIVGWSYGGYAAAMGAVKAPDLYSCAVSINGVLNLPRLIADDRDYIGGTEWTKSIGLDEARASEVSPYHQAERIEAPILVIQAEDDTRVHADQGRRFARQLERLDKDVEYVEVEFGGHNMYNEEARRVILDRVGAFLDKHIGR